MRNPITLAMLLLVSTAAFAQLPANDLIDDLGRLSYDARSAGMGGAGLAVSDMVSAPVENAASLGLRQQPRFSLNYMGESNVAGPFGAADFFLAAIPTKAGDQQHFDRLWGYSQALSGERGYGEITVLGTMGYGPWRIYGTKGAIGQVGLTTSTPTGSERIEVVGEGVEYETLGGAYGWSLGSDLWMGLSAREVRYYRADLDFTVDRSATGATAIDDSRTEIIRGLEWAADVSLLHRPNDHYSLAMVLRHVNSPRFHTGDGLTTWRVRPSMDIGAAYQKPGGRSLFALDVRDVFGTAGGRPVLRLGWEYAFSNDGRWRGRMGLRDGRPSLGVGWQGGHGAVDLAFGPNPTQRLSLTASFSL